MAMRTRSLLDSMTTSRRSTRVLGRAVRCRLARLRPKTRLGIAALVHSMAAMVNEKLSTLKADAKDESTQDGAAGSTNAHNRDQQEAEEEEEEEEMEDGGHASGEGDGSGKGAPDVGASNANGLRPPMGVVEVGMEQDGVDHSLWGSDAAVCTKL